MSFLFLGCLLLFSFLFQDLFVFLFRVKGLKPNFRAGGLDCKSCGSRGGPSQIQRGILNPSGHFQESLCPVGQKRQIDVAGQKLPRDNFCLSLVSQLPSPQG